MPQTAERLTDLKRRITDEHRVALVLKRAALVEAESRLIELHDELALLRAELGDLLRQARVISPTQMLIGDVRRQAMLESIEVQQEEVKEAEEEVELVRNALLDARRDTQLMERQRARDLHRHVTRRRRGDLHHIDERTAQRL